MSGGARRPTPGRPDGRERGRRAFLEMVGQDDGAGDLRLTILSADKLEGLPIGNVWLELLEEQDGPPSPAFVAGFFDGLIEAFTELVDGLVAEPSA